MTYSAEALYFGPLHLEARSPVFLAKWQRILGERQKTLSQLTRARHTIPEHKRQDLAQQIRWITELLA